MNSNMWKVPPAGTRWLIPPNTSDIPHYTGQTRNTGWKIDTTTTPNSFTGRPLVPDDAKRTKYDDDGEEDLLRLGAPSQKFWTPLVSKWGLQVLNAAGFINGHVPVKHTDPNFDPKGRFHTEHADDAIHPVFRRDMWLSVSDADWNLILPSVRLATAILDTPEMLTFFGAFFEPFTTVHAETMKEDVKLANLPKFLDRPQLETIYLKVVDMRNCTRFHFLPQNDVDRIVKVTGQAAYGVTYAVSKYGGMIPSVGDMYTSSSLVAFTEAYLNALRLEREPDKAEEVLNYYQDLQKANEDRKIHIDPASAGLRTTYGLAQSILHEFGHAVCKATFLRKPKAREPYFPGDRYSEVGHAIEKYMFGGSIKGNFERNHSMEQAIQAPYGMSLTQDPTWVRDPGLVPPYESYFQLPVHMAWISALFQKEFWEDVVAREGGKWLQTPRFYEWATITRHTLEP